MCETKTSGLETGDSLVPYTGVPEIPGIPIPKTLVILTYPSHITLAIWVRVRVTGDAHITSVSGMGMYKTRRYLYHCDTGA